MTTHNNLNTIRRVLRQNISHRKNLLYSSIIFSVLASLDLAVAITDKVKIEGIEVSKC